MNFDSSGSKPLSYFCKVLCINGEKNSSFVTMQISGEFPNEFKFVKWKMFKQKMIRISWVQFEILMIWLRFLFNHNDR